MKAVNRTVNRERWVGVEFAPMIAQRDPSHVGEIEMLLQQIAQLAAALRQRRFFVAQYRQRFVDYCIDGVHG